MNDLQPGTEVTFLGWIPQQVQWGNNDTPDMLTVGETYTIVSVDVRSSHTKVTIEGYEGRFNSVHFEPTTLDLPPIEPWIPSTGDIVVFQKWCYTVSKVNNPEHIELNGLDGVFTTDQLSPL